MNMAQSQGIAVGNGGSLVAVGIRVLVAVGSGGGSVGGILVGVAAIWVSLRLAHNVSAAWVCSAPGLYALAGLARLQAINIPADTNPMSAKRLFILFIIFTPKILFLPKRADLLLYSTITVITPSTGVLFP
jgi:hypothetical protein